MNPKRAPLARLSEIALSITDGDHQAPPKAASGVPFLTIAAINNRYLSIDRATRYVPETYFAALKPDRKPQVGDVLFSVTGSIAIPAIVDDPRPFTFQRHIAIIKPNADVVDTRYLWHALQTSFVKEQARSVATGTAQPTIPLGGLRNFQVPLPSLPEQRRIVAKIDSLTGKSRRASDHLNHIPRLVEKYRQAVLVAAFRGDLTRGWREKCRSVCTAEQFCNALARSRQWRWMREAKRKAALRGKTTSESSLMAAYEPFRHLEPEQLDAPGWYRVELGAFAFALGGKRLPKGSPYADAITANPYVRVTDFADGRLNVSELKYILPETHAEIAQYCVETDDVCISIAGTIGASFVVPGSIDGANLTENAARLIVAPSVLPDYLDLFLKSPDGQSQIASATVATGQPKLALFRIEHLKVPVPAVDEQRAVVEAVKAALRWIDHLASDTASAQKLIDHLDQVVLAKAFRGELVLQGPADEPAGVLLERIRAGQRSSLTTVKHGSGRQMK